MTNAANEMSVFERVIECGSFAAGAQDVGLPPSAVSKLIMRLEQRLGVRLINRTTRRLALTAEGKTYLTSYALAGDPCGHRGGGIGDRFSAHVTARPPACTRTASHDRRSFWSGVIGVFGSLSADNDRFPGNESRGRSRRGECGHCDADRKTSRLVSDSLQNRRSHADYLRQSRVSGAPRSPAYTVRSHAPSMFDSQWHPRTDNLDVSW